MVEQDMHCTLSGAELAQRIADWRELGEHALRRTKQQGRVVTTFPRRDDVARKLDALIAAEAGCCTFMTFEVNEGDDEIVVQLSVPDEMTPMLDVMLGAVTSPQA